MVDPSYLCFGIARLGTCPSYNPFHPPSFLTLGGALSTLTLVLTFLQLTKSEHRFRVAVRRVPRRLGITAFIGTFICAAISSALQIFSAGYLYPVLGYSVFWEWLGAFLAFAGLIVLAHSHLVPVKFSRRNAFAYLAACKAVLASNDEDARTHLATELALSARSIVVAAQGKHLPSQRAAKDLEHLFSHDSNFCKLLVGDHPQSLMAMLSEINSHNPRDWAGFIRAIAREAFISDESVLEREVARYQGLLVPYAPESAPYPNYPLDSFALAMFRSNVTVLCNPLAAWPANEELVHTDKALVRYNECLKLAAGCWMNHSEEVSDENVVAAFVSICETLRAINNSDVVDKSALQQRIVNVIYEWFRFLNERKSIAFSLPLLGGDFSRAHKIADAVAELCARVIRIRTYSQTDPMPHEERRFLVSVFSSQAGMLPISESIRKKLLAALAEELLDFIHRSKNPVAEISYNDPYVSRVICKLFRPWDAPIVNRPPFRADIAKDVKFFLEIYYPLMHRMNQELAPNFLPEDIEFRASNLTLVRRAIEGKREQKLVALTSSERIVCPLESRGLHTHSGMRVVLDYLISRVESSQLRRNPEGRAPGTSPSES